MVDFLDQVAQNLIDHLNQNFRIGSWCKGLFTSLSIFIFRGTLPWQPIKSRKIGVFCRPIYFVPLPFGNGLQYRNSDFKRFNRMNFSTLCTILVAFGPVISEFTLLSVTPFAAIQQKSAYHAKYLRISWTYLDPRFGRHISRDVTWNNLLLFASAFDNGLADRKSAFKRFNGNNQATSYPNLVNFLPTISEFTLLKRTIFAVICPQFDDDLHSSS